MSNGRHSSDWITDLAIDFMAQENDEPFFVYLGLTPVHSLWNVEQHYIDPYFEQGYSLQIATIYGYITILNDAVKNVVNAIDENGLSEDTVVIFLSDNGHIDRNGGERTIKMDRIRLNEEEKQQRHPSKLKARKPFVYEGGIRVPSFFRYGSHWKPQIVDTPSATMDIFPTL